MANVNNDLARMTEDRDRCRAMHEASLVQIGQLAETNRELVAEFVKLVAQQQANTASTLEQAAGLVASTVQAFVGAPLPPDTQAPVDADVDDASDWTDAEYPETLPASQNWSPPTSDNPAIWPIDGPMIVEDELTGEIFDV